MRNKFILYSRLILIYFILLTITQSCFIGRIIEVSKMKKEFTEENDAIPPEFGKHGTVLLLINSQDYGSSGYNGYLRRAFKKNYFGEYRIVKDGKLSNNEFSNKEIFRYAFDYSSGSTTNYGSRKRYLILDRLANKTYQSGAEFIRYAKAIKIYAKNLEKKRKLINKVQ